MLSATDSALKCPALRAWIWIGLGACLSGPGCAEMQLFRDDRPMLGAMVEKPSPARPRGGDLYAERLGPGVARSKALLAQQAAPGRDPNAPVAVALQPPVTLPPATDAPTALAANPNSNASRPPSSAEPEPEPDRSMADSSPALAENSPPDEATETEPVSPTPTLETILAESRARLDRLTSYQVAMNRRERVGQTLQVPEDVVLSVRRNPKAIRLEWAQGPHKGREVIYEPGAHGDRVHINMADSAIPVPRLALPVDSPLALRNSRHPITEAGFDSILENMEDALQRGRSGDPSAGKLAYAGLESSEHLKRPAHKIVRKMPSGEIWQVLIDTETKLPVLVQANAANGDLLERYSFGEPECDLPELAATDAFDPERRWGPAPGGLLQRIARAGAARPEADSTQR